ncbi:MAG: NAD-dependent dehydratase [Pelagibacteraceae bacterium]|nr:NAD-dependent dehydratase [Pelagibacteraceae bacterium]|tara:strand:- start:15491 stop:16648 length:1158 start_codon:yes stop_codon:yes gene_type:complete
MRILILGGDGYLGWPTAMHFSNHGHDVAIADNMVKRHWEEQMGVSPLFEIKNIDERISSWKNITKNNIKLYKGDLASSNRFTYKIIKEFNPEAVVHYAEQPSAPFSMIDRERCLGTTVNNINSTINLIFAIQKHNPNIHIIKLGTMGEYGTPNIDIEEGWIDINHNGRSDKMLYPKKPGSFYHCSKVADSVYLEFVCRSWGLKVTDLNQGVVYGIDTKETLLDNSLATSFHYDSIFGTVLNRFMTSAVMEKPLLIYGNGSQTRGFLNIHDTIKCIELSILNPPEKGEFRVFNQFTEQYSIAELAKLVVNASKSIGIDSKILNIDNPRVEQEDHYYNAKHSNLESLGLQPILLKDKILITMLKKIKNNAKSISSKLLEPNVRWNQK